MKKLRYPLVAVVAFLFITSCNGNDKVNDVTSEGHFNQIIGEYTGTFLTTSGQFILQVNENHSSATINYESEIYYLSSKEKVSKNDKTISLTLTNDSLSLEVRTEENGTNPKVIFEDGSNAVESSTYKLSGTGSHIFYIGNGTLTRHEETRYFNWVISVHKSQFFSYNNIYHSTNEDFTISGEVSSMEGLIKEEKDKISLLPPEGKDRRVLSL